METIRKTIKLPAGQDYEEIYNFVQKLYNTTVEFDSSSKLIANLQSEFSELDYIQLNTDIADAPSTVGAIYWDSQDQTPTAVLPNGVRLQFGKEQYIDGLNKTTSTITNGSVVYVSGAQGNRMTADFADADNYNDSVKVIGLATQDIDPNVNGNITTFGIVRDLNTADYTEGDCLYLSQTAGAYTTVSPSDGIARVKVGIVVKSHVSQGEVFVCVKEEKYMFGDVANGDYSYFESDGTYVAKGGAFTWRDEYAGGQYFVPDGANAPDEVNVTIAGVTTKKYAFNGVNTTEKLGNTFEIAHDVAIDAVNAGAVSIEQHIHFANSTTTASGTATFVVNWALIKAQGSAITGSNVTISHYIESTQQYHNLIAGGYLVPPTEGFGIGDLIEFTVTRDPSLASDTFEADVLFYKTALHVPLDMLGSRQIYIK